jgi:[ribosomal protein S5]-alanine N-acetyltransferase
MSLNKMLESERLYYRPVDISYCNEEYLHWLNDEEVNRYLEIFEPYTMDRLHNYLETVEKNDHVLFWAIHIKKNNKHIGNIKIDPINRYHGNGEYGIMMGDRFEWGKGYAEEASKRVIDYCFNEEALRKITLGVVKDNIGAVNLYKKLGFEIEGIYKRHGLYDGKYCDLLRMAVFNPAIQYE